MPNKDAVGEKVLINSAKAVKVQRYQLQSLEEQTVEIAEGITYLSELNEYNEKKIDFLLDSVEGTLSSSAWKNEELNIDENYKQQLDELICRVESETVPTVNVKLTDVVKDTKETIWGVYEKDIATYGLTHQIDLSDNIYQTLLSGSEQKELEERIKRIEEEFSHKTSIANKTDLAFLTIAIALQVTKSLVFPYVAGIFSYGEKIDSNKRLAHNDKSIKKAQRQANDSFKEKHKQHGTGHWINLLYQTVPYDITAGSKELGINMGGPYHRMVTLGHDPVLGWIFGTANILTDCITFNTFQTNRISRIDPFTGGKKMVITPELVPMGLMFKECYDEISADFLNLPAALFAQAQHLKSDAYTKVGLPVPVLSIVNPDFASKLYQENYDALCLARDVKIVGASFIISKIFDMIITLFHGLYRTEEEQKDLFEVRTRKILLLSNSIASTSTIISTALTNNPKNLDIGSLLNTISHLFTDTRFILKIKQEFIESEISEKWNEILENLKYN